jgi:MarR family transcriptional regulator, transcriptional regulator for hemolysin
LRLGETLRRRAPEVDEAGERAKGLETGVTMLIISVLTNTPRNATNVTATKHFDPDRSLGVLMSDLARLLRRNFDRRLQSLGLTQAQWRAIVNVSRTEGMSQAALAECLEIQPITVGRLIDRMEAAGWIERRGHPSDRRAVQLYLTAKCQPIIEEIRARAADTMSDALEGISASTERLLFEQLQRIKQNLVAAEPKLAAAALPIDRTNRNGARKPTRLQRGAR